MSSSPRNTPVRFRDRVELLDFLLEVATVAGDTLDLDIVLPQISDFIAEVIPHELLAILFYSEKLQGLRIRYSRGHRDELVKNLVIPLGEGVTGIAAARREPMLVADVRRDSRYLNALDAVRSELAVPMVHRGRLVGVIDLQSTRLAAFSNEDRSLLRLLASRVAASVDNARLYRRVDRTNRTLRILSKLSQEFSSILQLDELLARIAVGVRGLINYDAFSVLLVDPERRVLRHRFSMRYDQRVDLDNIQVGAGITGAAAQSREAIRVDDTSMDPRYIPSHPGIRSEVAVPLIVQDRVIGVMDLESEKIAYFTDDHVRTLTLLVPQIATSVENARLYEELAQREKRMEDDLKAARNVQSLLLPKEAPPIPGLEIAIGFRPCHDISGDVYDFFEQDDTSALLAFGDVSGKGAAAALYGALVSGLLRTLAFRKQSPAALMKRLNDILLERRIGAQYVTLLLMQWEQPTRRLTLSNAGALLPLICRGPERIPIHAEGIPLGLLADREYDEVDVHAQPGDVIVLYSDGVQDQPNDREMEFGRERIFRAVKRACGHPPREIVQAIFDDLGTFKGATPDFDDQTLVVMKVS